MAQTQPGPTIQPPPDSEFEQLLNVLNRGLSQIRDAVKEVDFGSSTGHAILSSDHTDIATGTVVRGDIIRGNSTPAWAKLGIGAANRALVSDGTDPAWSQLDHGAGLSGLGDDDHTQYVLHSILTTRGDIFFRNATTSARLAVGASAGMFLRSDATDPVWSTLILPNSATVSRIPFATATDTWGDSVNLRFDGTSFGLGSGPHAVGTTENSRFRWFFGGAYTAAAGGQGVAFLEDTTLTTATDQDGSIFLSAGAITATGTCTQATGFKLQAPTLTGTVTTGVTMYIQGAPTGATTNLAFWVDAGAIRLDAATANGTVATAMSSLGPAGSNTTIQEWLTINVNGTVRYIPCF